MRRTTFILGFGALLLPVLAARGEIIEGVMAIKGAEMS
jgi:hypothetical protein